jgi:hypothetical protein
MTAKFRSWSVLALLAVAGVALSAAAIALLVGSSQAQLGAATGGSADLFRYPWFLAGLGLAAIGAIWGALAICSARAQSGDRRGPALSIEVEGNVYQLDTDSKTYTKLSIRVRNIGHSPLYGVRLLLLGGNPVKATYYLRAEHDEFDPFTRSITGSVCPVGESLFFQIAEMNTETDEVIVKYAHNRLPADHKLPTPSDQHSTFVMLRAEGRRIDDNGFVFAREDADLFMAFAGPGGLRLKKRETVLEGTR